MTSPSKPDNPSKSTEACEKDTSQAVLAYIHALLHDTRIPEELPEPLREVAPLRAVDETIRGLRKAIKSIGEGKLAERFEGRGYLMGAAKGYQATLRNLLWQTKSIASGDFSQRLTFLGDFSDAFNHMVETLEQTIGELSEAKERLRESEAMHRLLADNANDVIWMMDLTGKFTYVSPSVEKLRGYTAEEVMGQTPEEVLCPASLIQMEKGLAEAYAKVTQQLPFGGFRGDLEQPCKNGTTVWTDVTVSGIYNEAHQFLGMLGVSRDITERRRMEAEIRRLTEIDRLTQIYNRHKLDEVMNAESERSCRTHAPFSLILLDVDDFKHVNDQHGHPVGDVVLKELAAVLRAQARKLDVAGRWGGEEFMLILPETAGEGGVVLAEKIRQAIAHYAFTGVGRLTASFGVAQSKAADSPQALVYRVDQALYEAKNTGKNRVVYHPVEMADTENPPDMENPPDTGNTSDAENASDTEAPRS